MLCYECREEDDKPVHGHVTSLAVLRTHRKLGLATKLMLCTRTSCDLIHMIILCNNTFYFNANRKKDGRIIRREILLTACQSD